MTECLGLNACRFLWPDPGDRHTLLHSGRLAMMIEDVMTADVSTVAPDPSGHESPRLIRGGARADTNGAR